MKQIQYLDKYMENSKRYEHFLKNMDMLSQGIIPEMYYDMEDSICSYKMFMMRDDYISKYGFMLIARNWIIPIIDLIGKSKCLEVMGGNGLLSYTFKCNNVDITCTDNYSWENELKPMWKNHYCDIELIDAVEAIEKYGKDVEYIVMAWPYMDDTAYRCLLKMREVNPNCKLIYIGESSSGCTANDDFFINANFIYNFYINKANEKYARFYGMHDRIYLIN